MTTQLDVPEASLRGWLHSYASKGSFVFFSFPVDFVDFSASNIKIIGVLYVF